MARAKPLTRIHRRSELTDSLVPKTKPKKGGYVRENSARVVRGTAGTKTDNVRGRFSEPDRQELEDLKEDPELRARVQGRRNKLTASVKALKKA